METPMRKTSKLQSQWTLGWSSDKIEPTTTSKVIKYHNESQVKFQDKVMIAEEQQNKRKQIKRKTQESFNSKLPVYDPKQGGKSSIHFGDTKVDYRKKDQIFTNSNMKAKGIIG